MEKNKFEVKYDLISGESRWSELQESTLSLEEYHALIANQLGTSLYITISTEEDRIFTLKTSHVESFLVKRRSE